MNKTKIKNNVKAIVVTVVSIAVPILLMLGNIIDISKLLSPQNGLVYDFQYNAIQTSAIIAGFLFSGVSILLSAIEKKRIKRLWDNNYLDNLYVFAFEGMISNLVTIVCALLIILSTLPNGIIRFFIGVEVVSLVLGVVSFGVCIKYLVFIILRLKRGLNDEDNS